MSDSSIKYPEMRLDMMVAIEYLANSEATIRIEEYNQAGKLTQYFDFDLAIHLLLDDMPGLKEKPEDWIGVFLLDECEAKAVKAILETLNIALDVDYPDDLDLEYVKTPRWQSVIEAAQNAMKLMN